MTMAASLITTMARSKRYLRNERRTDLQQHGLRRIKVAVVLQQNSPALF